MNSKRLNYVLAATLLVALTVGAAPNNEQNPDGDEKIRQLMLERVQVLEELVKAENAAFQAGRASADALYAAEGRLIDAQLDVAKDQNERIKLCEQHFQRSRFYEAQNKSRHSRGFVSLQEVLTARENRIRSEIRLEQEKRLQE